MSLIRSIPFHCIEILSRFREFLASLDFTRILCVSHQIEFFYVWKTEIFTSFGGINFFYLNSIFYFLIFLGSFFTLLPNRLIRDKFKTSSSVKNNRYTIRFEIMRAVSFVSTTRTFSSQLSQFQYFIPSTRICAKMLRKCSNLSRE